MKRLSYQILAFITHGKTQRPHPITINLKYQLEHGKISLNCLMDPILYQIFKRHGENMDKRSVKIYINKIEIELHLKLKMDTVLNF